MQYVARLFSDAICSPRSTPIHHTHNEATATFHFHIQKIYSSVAYFIGIVLYMYIYQCVLGVNLDGPLVSG